MSSVPTSTISVGAVERGTGRSRRRRRRCPPRRSRPSRAARRAACRRRRWSPGPASRAGPGAATTLRVSEWCVRMLAMPSASISPLKPTRSLMVRCGVSWSMIATSPLLTSRSTRQIERPLAARATPEVGGDQALADAALGGEDRDHLAARCVGLGLGDSRGLRDLGATSARAVCAAAWTSSIRVWPMALATLRARGDGRGDAGEVARRDDLAHAAAQRQRRGLRCRRRRGAG